MDYRKQHGHESRDPTIIRNIEAAKQHGGHGFQVDLMGHCDTAFKPCRCLLADVN